MIEQGTYVAKVVGVELGQASTGTPQVSVKFEISDGRTIWWRGYITDAAEEGTMNALMVLGWTPELVPFMELDNPALTFWKEASIVIEHEKDQKGELRARVRWVNDPEGGGSGAQPMVDADKARIGSRMAALYKKMAAKGPAKPVTEPKPDYLEVDDTPF